MNHLGFETQVSPSSIGFIYFIEIQIQRLNFLSDDWIGNRKTSICPKNHERSKILKTPSLLIFRGIWNQFSWNNKLVFFHEGPNRHLKSVLSQKNRRLHLFLRWSRKVHNPIFSKRGRGFDSSPFPNSNYVFSGCVNFSLKHPFESLRLVVVS